MTPRSAPAAARPTPARGQIIARAVGAAVLVMYGGLFAASMPLQYARLQVVCDPGVCADVGWFMMSTAEAEALARLGLAPGLRAAYHVGLELLTATVYVTVALLLLARRGGDRMAVLTALALLAIGLWMAPETPHSLHAAGLIPPALNTLLWLPSVPLMVMMLYLLPDGRFTPPWSRWVALAFGAWFLLTGVVLPAAGLDTDATDMLFIGLALPSLAVAGYGQVYRYRRVAGPAERQQIKWVGAGSLTMLSGPLIYVLVNSTGLVTPGAARLAIDMAGAALENGCNMALPIALGFAIMRYKLWDIDLVVRRTLTYAILSAALALIYLGSVIVLQTVVVSFTGQRQSELVTVISTLGIAALFVPVRTRVQQAIDRRFFRSKVDAAQALAGFAASARDETDLARLTEQLVQVVDQAMQPASVSLWVRPGAERAPGGRPAEKG